MTSEARAKADADFLAALEAAKDRIVQLERRAETFRRQASFPVRALKTLRKGAAPAVTSKGKRTVVVKLDTGKGKTRPVVRVANTSKTKRRAA